MVPIRLGVRVRAIAGGTGAAALIALSACARRAADADGAAEASVGTAPADLAARSVRAQYTARDIIATGAWTWTAADSAVYVLVDVQSTLPGLVQARLDLWRATDSSLAPVGRSDVVASAAEFGAYAFADLTGDGIPDFFGYVADSAGVSYPLFVVGARGSMGDALESAAPGWRFDLEEEHLPRVATGPGGPCALQLWVDEAPPDGGPAGWRMMVLLRGGRLGSPVAALAGCGAAAEPANGAGVQQEPATP